MSIAPVTVAHTFSESLGSGWSATDTGHTWSVSGLSLKENWGWGSIVNMANTGLGTARIPLTNYGIPEQTRDSILMRVQVSAPAQWPLTDFGPMLSFKSGNTFYYLALQGNWGEIAIGVFINGYRYEINRTSYPFGKGATFWVRFERHATGLRAKVWKDTQAEPSGWTLSTVLWDGSYPPGAGSPGIWKKGTRDSHDIEIKEFYYYASGASYPSTLPKDLFERTVTEGWGVSTSGHVWEGWHSVDPQHYAVQPQASYRGSVTPSNSRALYPVKNGKDIQSALGQSLSGDIENLTTFLIGSGSSVDGRLRVGLRGTLQMRNNEPQYLGYYVDVREGASTLAIRERRFPNASDTTVATSAALGFTINANTIYRVRFQVVGTTLKARIWQDGTTEPTTWQVTGTSSYATSGKLWIGSYQTTSPSRTIYIYDIEARAPTIDPVVVKNYAVTGDIFVTPGERSASFTAQHAEDANANATISVKYKPATATTWINHTGGIATAGNNRNFSLTGLQPSTSYNVQVTWQDADGIVGANPKQISFTTSSNSVEPNAIEVTDATTNSITVSAAYTKDVDNDSTATVAYRATSMETPIVRDYFVDEDDDEFLQNTDSPLGGEWYKHTAMTSTVNGIVSNLRIYTDNDVATDKALYYHDTAPPSAEYIVTGEFYAATLNGTTGVAARLSTTTETYYGAGIDGETREWELFKMENGTKTVLESTPFNSPINVVHKIELVVRDAYKAFVLNGTEILRTTDNTITDNGLAGYYSTNLVRGAKDNQFLLDSFIVTYRSPAGSWSSELAATIDRGTKRATRTLTGLASDTIYEIRVTFSDTDGTIGASVLLITAQTTGTAAGFVAMGSSPSETSAVVDIIYEYDSNNNAYIEFQYKSTMDDIWTTVPFQNVHTDRAAKKFSVTLTALLPSQTYSCRAYLVDPDGIIQGSAEVLTHLFTTKGFLVQDQLSTKHFVWKVYDTKDRYVSTIPDAPEPEFSIHQNGGVTDLSFELPRKMSELSQERIIDFQNRIDIWAVDPSSDGMGPNLVPDPDCSNTINAWTKVQNSVASSFPALAGVGPDGSSALRLVSTDGSTFEVWSNTIEIRDEVPLVASCVARASGAKLRFSVRAFDVNDNAIDSSNEVAETIGTDWQTLKIAYTPPPTTSYLRVIVENTGRGTMYVDKFKLLAKELLVYRGKIESYTPSITEEGERVQVEVLGLASLLSDDYIEFLQFVETQPQKDVEANRINYGAKDPADMMKMVIDLAKKQNPHFSLYYTTDSIQYTGNLMQYTFRDQQIRNCMDKIRTLCPAGWHYFIEADGKVWLRSQESAATHVLRIGVEILRFEVERSIRNMKNFVRIKGRQDEDRTEADGHGSINYIAFDQKSIDKYGKRTVFIRDAQLTDPESAKIVGDGRLEEYNREEQRVECYIPDNKMFRELSGSLRGYNIEAFRPGDTITIVDPVASSRNTFWDKFRWDVDAWDISGAFMPLPEPVPIVTIQNHGSYAQLQLSERPPSQVGDFSRLYRWMANKERE